LRDIEGAICQAASLNDRVLEKSKTGNHQQSSRYDALADALTAGRRPLPAMRCYGPTEALNNKSFKLPDFELIA
jgi:hypothetical protein